MYFNFVGLFVGVGVIDGSKFKSCFWRDFRIFFFNGSVSVVWSVVVVRVEMGLI